MICSHCKNEKWDIDVCPNCGLSEREALWAEAEKSRKSQKWLFAVKAYQKYLLFQPRHLEALQKVANCLSMIASLNFQDSLFHQASQAIFEALNEDWDWERGHELLIDLYTRYEKLEDLSKQYEQIASREVAKAKICENMVRTIRLTQKFKNALPVVNTSLDQTNSLKEFIKDFWFLFLLPLLLGAIYIGSTLLNSRNEKQTYFLIFLITGLGLSVLVTFMVSVALRRKKRTSGKSENQN